MCIILFYLGDFRICEDVDKKSWICCVFSQSNINFKVFELSKNRRTCDINTQRNVIMFNHNVKRVSRTHAEWFIAGTIFNAHIFSTCYLSPGPHLFEIIPFDLTSISSISFNKFQLKFRNTIILRYVCLYSVRPMAIPLWYQMSKPFKSKGCLGHDEL